MPHTIERYLNLILKELDGKVLSPEERALVNDVELVDELMPGALSEEILHYGLSPCEAPVTSKRAVPMPLFHKTPGYAVAASSPESPVESEVSVAVNEALARGETVYTDVHGAERLELFDLVKTTGVVAPRMVPGYEFRIEKVGEEAKVVGEFGGEIISLNDLRHMELKIERERKVIRLYEVTM